MIFFRIEESKDESESSNSADNEDVTIDENSELLRNGKNSQGIECASGDASRVEGKDQGNKCNGVNDDEISHGNDLEKNSELSKNDSNANPDSKTSIMDGKGCVKCSKNEYETFEIEGLDPEAVRMIFGAVAGFQGNIEGCQSFIVLEQMYQVDQIF